MARTPYSKNSYTGGAFAALLVDGVDDSTTTLNLSFTQGHDSWHGLGVDAGFFASIDYDNEFEEKIWIPAGVYDWSQPVVTVLNVTRGVDGTQALSHGGGAKVVPVLTAIDLQEANDAVTETIGRIDALGDLLFGSGPNTFTTLPVGGTGAYLTTDGNEPYWGPGPLGPQGVQGSQGATGGIGPQGSIGVTGAQGYQGNRGAQGIQGTKGPTGDTGPQGRQGYQGATGARGSQGFQGFQGNQGNQGQDGVTGDRYATTSATLLGITTGSKTLTVGQDLAYTVGQTVVIANSVTAYMIGTVSSYNEGTGRLVVQVSSTVGSGSFGAWSVNLDGAVGQQGAQGATGASGSQGTIGYQGSSGQQGQQGFQGSSGAQGQAGSQGNQGSQGSQGTAGAQGSAGATGSQGSAGSNGSQGNQGFQGSAGSQGLRGFQGYQGPQGSTGSQGYQGNQGFQGSGADLLAGAGILIDTTTDPGHSIIANRRGYKTPTVVSTSIGTAANVAGTVSLVGTLDVAPTEGNLQIVILSGTSNSDNPAPIPAWSGEAGYSLDLHAQVRPRVPYSVCMWVAHRVVGSGESTAFDLGTITDLGEDAVYEFYEISGYDTNAPIPNITYSDVGYSRPFDIDPPLVAPAVTSRDNLLIITGQGFDGALLDAAITTGASPSTGTSPVLQNAGSNTGFATYYTSSGSLTEISTGMSVHYGSGPHWGAIGIMIQVNGLVVDAAGPQGFQGFQGNQGFQGANGAQGTQGVQGTQGNQGNQGFQGATGATGPQGATGPTDIWISSDGTPPPGPDYIWLDESSAGEGVGVGDSRLWVTVQDYPDVALPASTWLTMGVDTPAWVVRSGAGSDISLNADGKTVDVATAGTYMIRLAFQMTPYHGATQIRFASGASAVGGNFPGWVAGDPDPLTIAVIPGENGDYIGNYIWRIAAGGSFTIAISTWNNTSDEHLDGIEMDIVRVA